MGLIKHTSSNQHFAFWLACQALKSQTSVWYKPSFSRTESALQLKAKMLQTTRTDDFIAPTQTFFLEENTNW